MSKAQYMSPQIREIAAAMAAAGCGVIRRAPRMEDPAQPAPVESLRDAYMRDDRPYPTLATLMAITVRITGIESDDIRGPGRKMRIVRARQIYCYIARNVTPRSLPAIGRTIGGRDHSTVLHGVKKVVDERRYYEPELSQILDIVKAQP